MVYCIQELCSMSVLYCVWYVEMETIDMSISYTEVNQLYTINLFISKKWSWKLISGHLILEL